MVKVLGLAGSPRGGSNTSILIDTALKAAGDSGAETKLTELSYLKLEPCLHCSKCSELGRCVQDDDLNMVVDLMVSADGIIFGSPVHYSTVSSQMKNLMDRVGRFVHLEGKVGCSLSVGRRSGLDLTISHMLFFMLVKEMIVPGGISWPLSFAMNVGDVRSDNEGLEMARQMGHRVAELATILSEKPVSWKDVQRPDDKKSRFGDEWKKPD